MSGSFSPYNGKSDINLDSMMKEMKTIQDFCKAKYEASAIRKVQTGLDFWHYMDNSKKTRLYTKLKNVILESIRSLAIEHELVEDASEIDDLVKTRTSFVDYLNSKSRRKPQEDDSIYSIPTDDNL